MADSENGIKIWNSVGLVGESVEIMEIAVQLGNKPFSTVHSPDLVPVETLGAKFLLLNCINAEENEDKMCFQFAKKNKKTRILRSRFTGP